VTVALEAHVSPGFDRIIVELAAAIAAHTLIADALIHQTITLFADRDASITHRCSPLLSTKKREKIEKIEKRTLCSRAETVPFHI
jgi:hypothetical protein